MTNYIINQYTIGNSDSTEVITLGRSEDNQTFYIRNEYGNFNIEFDLMTGFEMINRMKSDMETYINQELQTDFELQNEADDSNYPDSDISNNECEGDIPGEF